jgi:hypothetical protein
MYRVVFFLIVAGLTDAAAQAVPPDCAVILRAIDAQKTKIEEARRVLSAEEADCAFAEVESAPTRHCAGIKAAAFRNFEKRRIWDNAIFARHSFDRLRLQLRATEDRLGVTCTVQ